MLFGFFPQPLLDVIEPAVETTLTTSAPTTNPPCRAGTADHAEEDNQ